MAYEPDDKDKKIIEILQEHGDYTTRQIAKKTLLPVTTIHNRIRKMKQEGVIRKFTIEPEYSKIDKGMKIYLLIDINIMRLQDKKRTQYDIVDELKKFDFIEKADIVTGGTNIVAIIRVKDIAEYDKVLLNKIQEIDCVENTQSMIVIH